ncbi:MAG: BBP7 family outer membrane beta-barrel protein [Planctomycetaceae bacterium]|nr:BBP7 family outer membrane beta-barrel protein [Planctomycetaceae bacterium]
MLLCMVVTAVGIGTEGTPAAADGFDNFVAPQPGPQTLQRRSVRTANDSVLVPSADPEALPVQQPAAGPGGDVETWTSGQAWEVANGTTCLDGSGVGCEGENACGACGGAGCGRYSHVAGLFQRLCGDACPRWVVQIDALMLWPANIASRPLLNSYDPVTDVVGPTALNANQAQPPMSAGPRVGLIYNFNQCHAIEGNYFQVRPFTGQATSRPGFIVENNLAGNTFPIDTDTVFDSATIFTRAGIQSAELNWRKRECWCPITWLAGFRWVEWDQQLHVDEVAAGSAFTSLFRTDTINNLYGGQLGMDLGLWTGSTFNVNGIGKAGAFLNHAAQASKYQDSLGSFESVRAQADGIAFFGELGVNGNLQLTNWLAWRLGYSLFWLSGVAVPANQLSVTNLNLANPPSTARLDTNGSVLLHGVTTGLEARW